MVHRSATKPGASYTKAELQDIEDDYRKDQKEQYAKRQEERFGRLARYSLDEGNRKRYQRKENEWKSVAKDSDSGIMKQERFSTEADPMREVIGSAENSHPEKLQAILDDLSEAGVSVRRREKAMGYSPANSPGEPGELLMEENASYSAWLHEYKHFCDDRDDGYLGMRVFADTEKCIKREVDAYEVEIELAKSYNRSDMVERLETLRDKEVSKYEWHTENN